ncbi:MAG: hypothetical protein JO360_13785, partial [Acidobacteria bacterium]|nr:hypothetical protein [Acidobacteriota bacterium]
IPEDKDTSTGQLGRFLLSYRRTVKDDNKSQSVSMEVRDVRTGEQLWTREFPKGVPSENYDTLGESFMTRLPVTDERAKAELKNNAALSKRLATMKEKEGVYLLQVFDLGTGRLRGSLLVDTAKDTQSIWYVRAMGDRVAVFDTSWRIRFYSLASGELLGQIEGTQAALAKNSELVGIYNDKGRLVLYNSRTMQQLRQLDFQSPVIFARFSDDSRRLFALTHDQTVYVLDVAGSVR